LTGPPGADGPAAPAAGGARLAPRAARTAVAGLAREPDGAPVLKVGVAAPPEGGKANAALVGLLAKEWRLPKSAIGVTAGAKDRRKTLLVSGDGPALAEAINRWAARLG
jgi:hypothetical protein